MELLIHPSCKTAAPHDQWLKGVIRRLLPKIQFGAPDACWPWQASTNKAGYGVFWDGSTTVIVTRFIWWLTTGEGPGQLDVLHTCDMPPCCNPAHLWLGTNADNHTDKIAKGRQHRPDPSRWRGENNPQATLTDHQVAEIRRRYTRYSRGPNNGAALAKEFGVTPTAISYIVRRVVRT